MIVLADSLTVFVGLSVISVDDYFFPLRVLKLCKVSQEFYKHVYVLKKFPGSRFVFFCFLIIRREVGVEEFFHEQTGRDFSKGTKSALPLTHIFPVCIPDTYNQI